MISVELNTAIKSKFLTLGSPYNTLKFIPMSAYNNTKAPFVIYNQIDNSFGEERFFMSRSTVLYTVYDVDISRMKDIVYQLDLFLDVADNVSEINSLISTPYYGGSPLRYRIVSIIKESGMISPAPSERDGFNFYMVGYRVVYLHEGRVVT